MLTIYKASAGSGKTYNLAFEYIRTLLTLKHPDGTYALNGRGGRRYSHRHRGILAITFTNAATDEMKERIVLRLDRLAHMDDDGRDADGRRTDYAADLAALTGCSMPALREAARLALAELLTDYSHFNVSTIDSFFQSVLRTFAREIDHQGDYELAIENGDVIRQSLSLMLDDVNYSDSDKSRRIAQWLREYMAERLLEGEKFNVFERGGYVLGTLSSTVDKALNEVFYRYADKVRAYLANPALAASFRRRIGALRKSLPEKMQETAGDYILLIENALPDGGYNANFYKLALAASKGARPTTAAKWFDAARNDGLEADISTFVNKAPLAKLVKSNPAAADAIAAAGNKFIAAYVDYSTRYRLCSAMLSAVGSLEFIGHASVYLEKYLRDNNMMLIADSGELLNRIIGEAEIPFIYERTGSKLTNLLIDEFQDTSVLQWDNLRPLVENSVANGNDSLIIGDVKQAIYRFRNSDPTLLGHTVPDVDFGGRHISRGDTPADNVNHRSSPGIVMLNNTLFGRIGEALHLPGYDSVLQQVWSKHADEDSYIRIEISKKPADAIYDEIADAMRRQHDAGYRWRDMAVLVRGNDDAKDFIEHFLREHPDIRLLSNEALLLSASPAVRMIMSMLRLVENAYVHSGGGDGEEKSRYADNDDIAVMVSAFDYMLGSGADTAAALADALDITGGDNSALIDEIRSIKNRNSSTLVALIENIIALKLPPEMKASQQAYISALQDRAIDHVAGADPSVSAFIESYAANRDKWAIQAPSGEDAVQVMTIHKAKGLGRPCIFMPKAKLPLFGTRSNMSAWVPVADMPDFAGADDVPPLLLLPYSPADLAKPARTSPIRPFLVEKGRESLEDTINVAYVAFTRAEREMYVYAEPGSNSFAGLLADTLTEKHTPDAGGLTLDTAVYTADADGVTVFEYGSHTTPRPEDSGKIPTVDAPPYEVVSHDSTRSLTTVDDILADTIETGDEYDGGADGDYTNAAMRAAARRGTALHAVLAEMHTADDLADAVRRVAMRLSLSDDESSAMQADLQKAFDAAPQQVKTWFSPQVKVYSERAIYDADNREILRPDRVVKLPDGTMTVIDYKFTTRYRTEHRHQVERYAALISEIDGAGADAYLWYPLAGKIIKA